MGENQLPEAFELQMQAFLGPAEFALFQEGLARATQTSIRLNPKKPTSISFPKRPIPWAKEGYFLEERPSFTGDPSFHAGAYYVQEASSMFIAHILESQQIPKGIYLDLAAAPGGKSTLLSSYLGEKGLLVANEVIAARTQILKENVIKWGLGNTLVSNNDPEHFSPLDGFFDLVLVDGDHSEEGGRADLENTWPLVTAGGCLAFHDITHPAHPYLERVFDEFVHRHAASINTAHKIKEPYGVAFAVRA